MKSVYIIPCFLIFVVMIAGCATTVQKPEPTATKEPESQKIGLVMKALSNPFFKKNRQMVQKLMQINII